MEQWVKDIANQAKKTYGSIEIKTKNNNHYLYKTTSKRLPNKKYPQKITGQYIGKITPQGITTPQTNPRTIYEHTNAMFLLNLLNDITPQLQKNFPNHHKELTALTIVKTLHNTPIKYVKDAWEKLYPSTQIQPTLNRNTLSETLREIGANWDAQSTFFSTLIKDQSVYYFDLSSIFSRSTNLNLAERGYNKEHRFIDQINFALLFSQEQKTPVMLKSMPGSVKDDKTLSHLVKEFTLKNCTAMLDRGFFSKNNIKELLSLGVSFVLPLKRNSKLINYDLVPNKPFTYRDRGIAFAVKELEFEGVVLRLFVFEDALLRGEEMSTLLKRKARDVEGRVVVDERRLGRVSMLTNLDLSGDRVYGLYKERELVEVAFDAMKNELENDKCYLGDSDAVRGYFFVSFLCLYLYFRVLERLRVAGLVGEVSVEELLFLFSKVYIVKCVNGKERLSEIPKKVEALIKKLDLRNVLP
jgi:transposase